MDVTDLANSLISMSAQKTQMSANMAVLKQQFKMEKSVLDILAPAPKAPGTGLLVDKSA